LFVEDVQGWEIEIGIDAEWMHGGDIEIIAVGEDMMIDDTSAR
jgi:hypothetical protein